MTRVTFTLDSTTSEQLWPLVESVTYLFETVLGVDVVAAVDAHPDPGATRTEWAHRNASGGASIHPTREAAEAARDEYHRERDPFEPRPPASLGIWRRRVTEWEQVQP